MRFPYQQTLGIQLRDYADMDRKNSYARNLGLSSITKGEGSIDLLPSDTSTTPEASFGNLPDGSLGVGARINGQMVNLATWSKNRTDQLQSAVNTEKSRNDSQDTTISNHTGRIGAVESKNSQQDQRLDGLDAAVGNAASAGTVSQLISQVASQALEIISLKARVKHLEDFIEPGRVDP